MQTLHCRVRKPIEVKSSFKSQAMDTATKRRAIREAIKAFSKWAGGDGPKSVVN